MPEQPSDLIEFSEHGRITVATVLASSVLSAGNVHIFGSTLVDYVTAHPKVNLLVNFGQVDYLSSAVLTELLRVKKATDETESRLRLTAVSPTILEIFQITNLDKIFTIHSDGIEADIKRFNRAIEIEAQESAWEATQKQP